MTADGYYVDPPFCDQHEVTYTLACPYGHPGPSPEGCACQLWQERHADLAATLRTILAMCAHTEKHHPGGPTFLARSIREAIEGTAP